MGFFSRVRDFFGDIFGGGGGGDDIGGGNDSPDWGYPFGSGDHAETLSTKGDEFHWYVAGYTPRGGSRENLEADPDRVLTESELRNADTLVLFVSGPIGYTTIGGPWDDWDHLWGEVADYYDDGGS